MKSTMTTKMVAAGRIVIPKEIRRQLRLEPDQSLELRVHDGHLEIEPAPLSISIRKSGSFYVAVANTPVPTMKAHVVTATREQIRNHDEE